MFPFITTLHSHSLPYRQRLQCLICIFDVLAKWWCYFSVHVLLNYKTVLVIEVILFFTLLTHHYARVFSFFLHLYVKFYTEIQHTCTKMQTNLIVQINRCLVSENTFVATTKIRIENITSTLKGFLDFSVGSIPLLKFCYQRLVCLF